MRRKRPFLHPVCLLLICGLLMAACASRAAVPAGASAPDLVAAAPEGRAGDALTAAAAAYQQASGEQVRVELYAQKTYTETVSAALLAGLPRFDLLYLPAETLPGWAAYHALLPISVDFERPPLEPWLPALTVDGQLFGLPTQPDPFVLWYRADLHEQAGLSHPPRDWETFRANALALNSPPERYGVAIAAGEGEAGQDFAALLAGYGAPIVTGPPEYDVQIDGPAARQVLAFYAGLRADGLTAPEAEQYTRGDVLQALVEGRAVQGFAPLLAGNGLAEAGLVAAWLPRAVWLQGAGLPLDAGTQIAVGDLAAWTIPRHAAHPQAAERFAAWLVSAEGARAWAEGGGLPAHRALLADLPAGAPPLPKDLAHELSEIQMYRTVFPPVRHNDLLWQALHAAAYSAAAGQAPVDAALARAADEMLHALRQGGTIPAIEEEE